MQQTIQFSAARFIPREYQTRAAIEAFKAIRDGHNPLIVAATGLGKTTIIGMICRDYPGRVLVLTHRLIIHGQLVDRISQFAPTGIIHGQTVDNSRVTVSPVSTIRRRLTKFDPGRYSLIVVDEVHRAQTKEYSQIFNHFTAPRIGFTATPDEVTEHFDVFAFNYPMTTAIAEGWLVPMRIRSMAENTEPGRVALVVSGLPGGSIIFSETVKHGKRIVDAMNLLSIPAALVTAESPQPERDRIIGQFKDGTIRALVNYGVITEGFDASAASNIIIARRVTKRDLFAQIVGRGLRPTVYLSDEMGPTGRKKAIAASDKPYCHIVDFGNNTIVHDLTSYTPSAKRTRSAKRLVDACSARPYTGDVYDEYRADPEWQEFFSVAERYNMSDSELQKLLGLHNAQPQSTGSQS